MRLFCFFVLISHSLCQGSDTVWIASPDMSPIQLKAHVTALGKSHKTYAQSQWEHLKRKTGVFQLKEKIKKAQEAYLSGDNSRGVFKSIVDVAYLGDWNAEQRRIILYSFLRLAQLESHPVRKKAFLISAGRFISEDLSSAYPEYSLFPPPLIEELNSLRNKQNSFLVDWKMIFPRYEIVLVNGKKAEAETRLHEGKYRITVLSSFQAPWIQTIDLSELLSGTFKSESLTSGYCDSLKIRPQWNQKNIKLLKRKDCFKAYSFDNRSSLVEQKKNVVEEANNNRFSRNQKEELFKQESMAGRLDSENSQQGFLEGKDFAELEDLSLKEESFFNKKNLPKWIIIGGAALALGAFIALSDSNPSPEKKVFH